MFLLTGAFVNVALLGCFSILPATELVPGDIVEVGVGCKVPADMRMVEMLSHQLRVDQAILTGESCSVAKEIESTSAMNAVYQDKTNILFSGTVVVAGRARAVVIGVGSNTAMGSIRDAMLRTEDEATPLKKKLDEFGTFLAKVIAGICILVWVVNIGHFRDPSHGGFVRGAIHYFKVAVALAVAAIPEGLPAVVTTCLALGTKRMARLNAIVRSLPSVETLGCTTVICSDKTGTLTTNMMSVSKVCVVHSVHQRPMTDEYSISGTTFAPDGFIYDAGGLQISVLEFSRDRKMMSVLCSRKQQEIMFSKGAPESIMARCTHILCNDDGSSVPLTMDIRNELEARFQSFAGKDMLRCLALALKRMPAGQQSICYDDEANLTFIGLVGMLDPPREEVRDAIHSCMSAGIRVIVVTGDNKVGDIVAYFSRTLCYWLET
ncbi:hypothetical protein PR202_ga13332 [Eleusine coracana subsp. coracana]|uniref:P-type ATPase A domain-containing protein n=1 Tax=Eleusine coracana subsp. coracana TaxID=191504 RepID=A0AAV5CEF0_ELECO|nr:hypothetical protein PR202_ga13332 [Eleusine coracana subsp. coracana]